MAAERVARGSLPAWSLGVALVGAILAATVAVVLLMGDRARGQSEGIARTIGGHIGEALTDRVAASAGRLEDARTVIGQDGVLRPARFTALARAMIGDRGIERVAFIVPVPAAERATWERRNGPIAAGPRGQPPGA